MIWSPQQETALARVADWLHMGGGRPFFLLDGWAGTGKTELAKHLAEGVKGQVFFASFTGKATSVLRQRGCPNATTIHSLIYCPADKSRKHLRDLEKYRETVLRMEPGEIKDRELSSVEANIKAEMDNLKRPGFTLNAESHLRNAALLIVDEYSMVDDQMGADIISFGVPVLCLGDREQLPPVFGLGYFTRFDADLQLTEIHRQAKDNPIIRMATDVREGRGLAYGDYGSSAVVRSLEPEQVLEADQILVGRNLTRFASNKRVRELRGKQQMSPYPLAGERLVCLRNNHDIGLLNGAIYTAKEDAVDVDAFINIKVEPVEGGDTIFVSTHREHYLGRGKEISIWDRRDAEEFDFGMAMTVHKFQGSQDKKIVLFDESSAFGKDARKHLYTGLTRAQEWVKVVRK